MLYLLLFVFMFWYCKGLRCFILNLPSVIYYLLKDVFLWFIHLKMNECKAYGKIDVYCGLFGRGKTLSATNKAARIYKKYNGRVVYNSDTRSYELQEVKILSNVSLNIPYEKLESTEQIINCHKGLSDMSVCIVLIDEASTQFNSRNFKTNISATLLNSMLTCRHHKFGMILTAQRFNHIDALIRQICNNAIECKKIWRFQYLRTADAWDLENCTNIKLVQHYKTCWFVRDRDYKRYDTSAVVDDIKRKQANGELLTDAEVLELQGNINTSEYNVKGRKMKKLLK